MESVAGRDVMLVIFPMKIRNKRVAVVVITRNLDTKLQVASLSLLVDFFVETPSRQTNNNDETVELTI